VALWTAACIPVQSVLVLLPGRAKVAFARIYWRGFARCLGLRVRVVGEAGEGNRAATGGAGATTTGGAGATTGGAGRIVFVSNHCSWLDIPVLGSRLDACFVSKDEVSRWPVVRIVARLGRTVFVTRRAAATARERDDMRRRLAAGDSLILFPEGTSSDGSRVLPFRSAFFAAAEGACDPPGTPPLIQPVSVVYDRLSGLPAGRMTRPVFAWYGDMDLASHAWRLAQCEGLRATILLHAPIDPRAFASRKALAQAVWAVVADGASTLRQNRPAVPCPARLVPDEERNPATDLGGPRAA
jgi:lyso-ornithine lipid O-acyltransferase